MRFLLTAAFVASCSSDGICFWGISSPRIFADISWITGSDFSGRLLVTAVECGVIGGDRVRVKPDSSADDESHRLGLSFPYQSRWDCCVFAVVEHFVSELVG